MLGGVHRAHSTAGDEPQQAVAADPRAGDRAADALLAVINDILDFSKIEAGQLTLETIDFDLHATVDEVAGLMATPAHDKGLQLVTS
ncbi:MAG: hypothetical protein WD226_11045, partial [Planctomycetota bacterium]